MWVVFVCLFLGRIVCLDECVSESTRMRTRVHKPVDFLNKIVSMHVYVHISVKVRVYMLCTWAFVPVYLTAFALHETFAYTIISVSCIENVCKFVEGLYKFYWGCV